MNNPLCTVKCRHSRASVNVVKTDSPQELPAVGERAEGHSDSCIGDGSISKEE